MFVDIRSRSTDVHPIRLLAIPKPQSGNIRLSSSPVSPFWLLATRSVCPRTMPIPRSNFDSTKRDAIESAIWVWGWVWDWISLKPDGIGEARSQKPDGADGAGPV